jgi:hypothetical protein
MNILNRVSLFLIVFCLSQVVFAAPTVRLAPPQAMFKDGTTLNQFVTGTLRFVLLHEIGHGFVDLYNIPVLGREEDAADRFATWWMSPNDQQQEDGTDAIAAMEWWLASAKVSEDTRQELAWWDEHGIDEQRAYQIACLLYGSDPEIMGPLAGRMNIPKERRNSCIREAQQNSASWAAFLQDQVSTLRLQLDGFIVPKNYVQPSASTAQAAQFVVDNKILESLQATLKQFKFPEGNAMVRLYAQDCGMANAFWSPEDKAIVLCYELVNEISKVGYAAGFR